MTTQPLPVLVINQDKTVPGQGDAIAQLDLGGYHILFTEDMDSPPVQLLGSVGDQRFTAAVAVLQGCIAASSGAADKDIPALVKVAIKVADALLVELAK